MPRLEGPSDEFENMYEDESPSQSQDELLDELSAVTRKYDAKDAEWKALMQTMSQGFSASSPEEWEAMNARKVLLEVELSDLHREHEDVLEKLQKNAA